MLEQAEENIGKQADLSLADAGFHSGGNLAECETRKQMIVMPESQDKALKSPYHKDHFSYDEKNDSYRCPCGQTLRFLSAKVSRRTPRRVYGGLGSICGKCKAFGVCTNNKRNGRELEIGQYEEKIRRHRKWMATDEAQEAYKHRKELIEPSFGIIKEAMGIRRFLLRGLNNVRAEGNLIATAFNLRTLYGAWKVWASDKLREFLSTMGITGAYIPATSTVGLFC